ncbi:MAG: hypothetical protein ACRDXX_18730 [Stackebrandtia sp.]
MSAEVETVSAFLEAVLRRDQERIRQRREKVENVDPSLLAAMVGAVFYLGVRSRFSDDADVRGITKFVRETQERLGDGQSLDARVAEAAVRGALGEEELLDGIDHDQLVATELTLIFAISFDRKWSDDAVENLLARSKELTLSSLEEE